MRRMGLCMLEAVEVIRYVLLCMLNAVVSGLFLLEVLEVLEAMAGDDGNFETQKLELAVFSIRGPTLV